MWKMIDGRYAVSDTGHVKNTKTGRVLKPMHCGRKGMRYATVRIGKENHRVHILVLTHFVGPRPLGLWGLHYDDDRTHNDLSNLYWGTPQANAEDKCGRRPNAAVADEIRRRRAAGEKGRRLAWEFGVSEQLVCDIHKGRAYSFL